ncbi:transposase [Actinoallomurus purpureus]|nr:transposase [Actinoallomurus purpureus]
MFAREVVAPGSTIHTDGAQGLRRPADMGYTHHYTAGYNAANRPAVLPAVYLIASLLRRWIAGTLHHRVRNEQLPYYLDECTLRFDRRAAYKRGLLFYRLFPQAVVTDPHPLHDLQRPTDPGYPGYPG